jgi:hypothetical protein
VVLASQPTPTPIKLCVKSATRYTKEVPLATLTDGNAINPIPRMVRVTIKVTLAIMLHHQGPR